MKTLFIIGTILIFIGSLLPWRLEGDPFPIWTNGIRIYPSIKDNGGVLVILLSILVVWLVFRSPSYIEKSTFWIFVLSLIIAIDVVFHIFIILKQHVAEKGMTGAPTIHIGLILVFLGSLIYLATSLYRLIKE